MSRTAVQTVATVAVAAGLTAALSLTANWRLGLLAAVAALAVAAMRVRYARLGALVVLGAVLALAATGASAGTDQRVAQTRRCADGVMHGGHRVDALRARGVSCAQARRVARTWLRARARRTVVRGFRCRGQHRLRCRAADAQLTGKVARGRR